MVEGPIVGAPASAPGLDPAAVANWRQPQVNLLQPFLQMQELQNQRLQNQRLLAQRAAGADYQASINPLTGRPDLPGFESRMAHDPAAAFAAQSATQSAIANATTGLQYHLQQTQALANINGAALAEAMKDPQNAGKYARQAATQAVSDGILSASHAATALAQLPDDPKQIVQHMQLLSNQLNTQAQSMKNILGSPVMVNTGNAAVPGMVRPYSGAFVQGGAPLAQQPANQVENIQGPTGTPEATTTNALLGTPVQPPGYAAPNNALAAPPVGPAGIPMPPMGNGVYTPPKVAGADAPTVASLPSSPPSAPIEAREPGAPVPIGPSPGTAAAVAANAAQNTQIGNQIISEGKDVAQTIGNLEDLGAQINLAQTGPMANALATYRAAASELGVNVGNKQATAEQVFTKLTNVIATSNMTGLGQGTDEKLATVLHATPNTAQTPEAAKTVLATAIGLQRYREARYQAYQAYLGAGQTPATAAQFNEQFQQSTSPLILGLPYMPPAQQVAVLKYIKTLPKSARTKFEGQLQASQKMGLLGAHGG